MRGLSDEANRVTSLRVQVHPSNHQYISIHFGIHGYGENDAQTKEFVFPIPAAAQLSRLLESAVEEYLYEDARKGDQN
jgi:uncharacterized membrane protein YdbT with pleckstrin-like domain